MKVGNYLILDKIASGAHSEVYYAQHEILNADVAIKVILKDSLKTEHSKELLRREIESHKKAENKFVTPLYEVIDTTEAVYLVMRYEKNGSLATRLSLNGQGITEEVAKKWFVQLLLGLRYIHNELKVLHRDIKLENILFDQNDCLKLIDFGMSNNLDRETCQYTVCGSPCYAAPEVITGQEYSDKADIYSAGVVLFLLLTGKLPFYDTNINNLFKKVMNDDIDFPPYLSPKAVDLLRRMLERDQKIRITLEEIEDHPWVETYHFYIKSPQVSKLELFKKPVLELLKRKGVNEFLVEKAIEENSFNSYHGMYRILAYSMQMNDSKRSSTPHVSLRATVPRALIASCNSNRRLSRGRIGGAFQKNLLLTKNIKHVQEKVLTDRKTFS